MQESWKTKVMQNLGGGGGGANKVHYGRCASGEYLNSISHLHGVILTQLWQPGPGNNGYAQFWRINKVYYGNVKMVN